MAKTIDVAKYLSGKHHARFIDERVPIHVISRIFQGRHLLRPCAELNAIIIGVIARARQKYPTIKLFAMAFMSNHMHLMMQGSAAQTPAFIGFIKREISRRWGAHPSVDWLGTMWDEYVFSALPTPQSQENALQYILSQGVHENLVERPQDWPGVHCAKTLMTGVALKGQWLDATSYSRARDAANRLAKPRAVKRADYIEACVLALDVPPIWSKLEATAQHSEARKLVDAIIKTFSALRRAAGKSVLGAAKVCRVPLNHMTRLPKVPWLERRRRLICWADPRDARVKAYMAEYWAFQDAFAEASREFRAGNLVVAFPAGAFRPVTQHAA